MHLICVWGLGCTLSDRSQLCLCPLQGVMEGGQPLAVKVFNPESGTALEAYAAEVGAYLKMGSLQGGAIPTLHAHGELVHCGCPVIATHLVGTQCGRCLSALEFESAGLVLGQIHDLGISHGDVRGANLLGTVDGKMMFCDFGRSCLDATIAQKNEDLEALCNLMR